MLRGDPREGLRACDRSGRGLFGGARRDWADLAATASGATPQKPKPQRDNLATAAVPAVTMRQLGHCRLTSMHEHLFVGRSRAAHSRVTPGNRWNGRGKGMYSRRSIVRSREHRMLPHVRVWAARVGSKDTIREQKHLQKLQIVVARRPADVRQWRRRL